MFCSKMVSYGKTNPIPIFIILLYEVGGPVVRAANKCVGLKGLIVSGVNPFKMNYLVKIKYF